MSTQSKQVIMGISIGVTVGVILVACFLRCIIWYRKRYKDQLSRNIQSGISLPIRVNSVDSSTILSESVIDHGATLASKQNGHSTWWGKHEKDFVSSASGITRHSYKSVDIFLWLTSINQQGHYILRDLAAAVFAYHGHSLSPRELQKATHNFTTLLGQGAFGPVYRAMMPTGETVAVKMLATNSKQGEKEFQTEVSLLGRLHHRNLVNLVGYCVDKGQRMLVYEFMTNGSLANHLYNEKGRTLSWEERVSIAQDVSRGIEYLHDGAIPPVVHRDIKAANILLDHLMRARVADFGLSKEEIYDGHKSGLKGTYGYMDPEYMSTNTFTQKSDVYSYGIFLFELITGRNPQQGLLDYINLAAINAEDKSGWDEILDSRLNGKCDFEEFRTMAALAYKCIQKNPRKRPAMRDMVQALSKFQKKQVIENLSRASSVVGDGNSEVLERIELQIAQLNKLSNISENDEA